MTAPTTTTLQYPNPLPCVVVVVCSCSYDSPPQFYLFSTVDCVMLRLLQNLTHSRHLGHNILVLKLSGVGTHSQHFSFWSTLRFDGRRTGEPHTWVPDADHQAPLRVSRPHLRHHPESAWTIPDLTSHVLPELVKWAKNWPGCRAKKYEQTISKILFVLSEGKEGTSLLFPMPFSVYRNQTVCSLSVFGCIYWNFISNCCL